ncbi:MAG: cell division protein ZapE, partial [Rhizobiales bacterium]|nr:cell division protein ZapE [Hyphomicrobiales bacterium]
TLIDMLYDNHVKLVASAEVEAHLLYEGQEGREASSAWSAAIPRA